MKTLQTKTLSKNTLSKIGRGGAVVTAAALSLGSTGADAAASQAFVASAPNLSLIHI